MYDPLRLTLFLPILHCPEEVLACGTSAVCTPYVTIAHYGCAVATDRHPCLWDSPARLRSVTVAGTDEFVRGECLLFPFSGPSTQFLGRLRPISVSRDAI